MWQEAITNQDNISKQLPIYVIYQKQKPRWKGATRKRSSMESKKTKVEKNHIIM